MSTFPKHRYTVEEYLELEEKAPYKSQYYDGEIFAMAGASLAHNRIISNIVRELGNRLQGGPCEALPSDMMVRCPTGLHTYPDVTVVCGRPEIAKHAGVQVLLNPQVIIEVLSDSTESFDRGQKFTHYQSASFTEYLLVAQDRYSVDQFWREAENTWRLVPITGREAVVELRSLACRLPLSAIYERVEVPNVQVLPRIDPPILFDDG